MDRSIDHNFIEWSLNNNIKDSDSGSGSDSDSGSGRDSDSGSDSEGLNLLFAGLWDLVRKVCNGSGAEGVSSRKPGILWLNSITIGLFQWIMQYLEYFWMDHAVSRIF